MADDPPGIGDDGPDPTQASTVLGTGPSPSAVPQPFPVDNWARYRFVSHVGDGAMGSVFKAHDPTLDRFVALKFLRVHDPALVERFRREARAQSRVEHDRICKVYDVGEVEGRPYIAMQFIDGVPLDRAARSMSLEQKLLALREIAEGLHEAHRKALIHRDLKPRNILVEHTAAGDWRPYLVDFGLAWEPGGAGATLPGTVLGTPAFMPPEQARGETDRVDRRSDVYGLGATLYAILAARPPFEGSGSDVLRKVVTDPPDSLRRCDPSIPADVEAIAMRCLRKDPAERYPSARALADDLQRYLDGEPVEARPTGVAYRLRLKAAKHRIAVATGAVALLLLLVTAGWAAVARRQASRSARLAETFTQQAQQIDLRARGIHLVPLHDIRGDRETLRAAVDDIERAMREAGPLGEGPGRFALGRGYMALEDYDTARRHLEAAWAAGFQRPDVAAALGRTIGELYRTALREVENAPDEAARQSRLKEVERDYREPALGYLQQARSAETLSPEYLEALLAFLEQRWDEALDKARAAYGRRPWIYEARRLEGDVYLARATDSAGRGAYDAALEDYERAREAYAGAMEVGRSDPAVYTAMCQLERSMLRTAITGRGDDVTPHFEAGLAACDLALQADPDHAAAWVLEAALHNGIGEYRRSTGEDPTEDLDLAVERAERALAIRPDDDLAYRNIGTAYRQRAVYERDRAQDPTDSLARSIEAYRRAIAIEPSATNHNDLGIAYKSQALYELDRGTDPRPSLERAIEAYGRSIAVEPEQVEAHANQGVAYYQLALYEKERGADPRGSLERSIAAFEQALAVNPNQLVVLYNMGRAFAEQATDEQDRGRDPRQNLQRAAEAYRKAIEINPESAYVSHFYVGIGGALDSLGSWERERGGDPRASFERAIAAYREAIASNPNNVYAHTSQAYVAWSLAEHLLERGEDAAEPTRMAIEAARRAVEINPGFLFAHTNLGDAYRVRARAALARGADPTVSLREAARAFEAALEINDESRYVHYAYGRLLTFEGRARIDARRDALDTLRRAEASLEQAIRLDPDDAASHLALADLYRCWAGWQATREVAPEATVERGIARVDRALALKPDDALALAVRGGLLLLKAKAGSSKGALEEARGVLDRALSANGNLAREYRPLLDEANRRLAGSGAAGGSR